MKNMLKFFGELFAYLFSIVIIGSLPIFITGCNDNSDEVIRKYLEKEKTIKSTIERISKEKFPKITWYDKEEFFVDGTRYVIYRRGDGGEKIINYTKDSLEIEFYKFELSKGQKQSSNE